jgi:hypothetical protein
MQSKWVEIVYRILSEKDKIRILFESSNKLRHANAIHNSTICKSWYSYLKKRHLFKRYMDRVYELIYNGWGSEYLLAITSYDRIRRVCKAIDEQVSGNGTWHWWQDRYEDFYWKRESAIINHKTAAKLYMVNKRDEPHSKYIGSCELKKSLYDKVIDGFFNLFK